MAKVIAKVTVRAYYCHMKTTQKDRVVAGRGEGENPQAAATPDDDDRQALIAAIGYAPVPLSIRDHPSITAEYRTAEDRDGLIDRILAAGFTRQAYRAADVQEAFERGCVRGEQDANERNWSRRQYETTHAPRPPQPEDAAYAEFEHQEQELFQHQPALSREDGGIVGCQCRDTFFRLGNEDWGTHLARHAVTTVRTTRKERSDD